MHRKTEYLLTWVLRCDAIGCAVAVDDAFTQRGQAEIVLLDSANLHTLVNYIRFYLVLYSLYSVHAPFGCCCEIQLSEKYANLKLRRKFFLKNFKLLGICHAGLLCSCWCVRRKEYETNTAWSAAMYNLARRSPRTDTEVVRSVCKASSCRLRIAPLLAKRFRSRASGVNATKSLDECLTWHPNTIRRAGAATMAGAGRDALWLQSCGARLGWLGLWGFSLKINGSCIGGRADRLELS